MAYNKKKIFEKAKKVIIDNPHVYFVQDIIAFVPCGKSVFYEFFPAESDEMETLKALLGDNKTRVKLQIRDKLAEGHKATELIALYKLICSDDEREKLSIQRVDHTSKGKEIKQPPAVTTLSDEQVNKLIDSIGSIGEQADE